MPLIESGEMGLGIKTRIRETGHNLRGLFSSDKFGFWAEKKARYRSDLNEIDRRLGIMELKHNGYPFVIELPNGGYARELPLGVQRPVHIPSIEADALFREQKEWRKLKIQRAAISAKISQISERYRPSR